MMKGVTIKIWYSIVLIGLFLVLTKCIHTVKKQNDYVSYVNCFVGTDGPGNTYPGVAMPFGMVQLSPDNGLPGWDRIAGYYWPDSTIAGFSHKHLTGTGAGDLYDILIMPSNSRFSNDLWPNQEDYRPYSKFSHDKEEAHPGYYAVDLLSSGIKAELTATSRVGMHRYTFPSDDSSKILLDLGYKLNWDDPLDTYLKLEDENTIVGYRFSTGWASDQREFFVAKFSKSISDIAFYENNMFVTADEAKAKKSKVVLNFSTENGEQVMVKVALSSHSIAGAKRNLEAELSNWNFDQTVAKAEKEWNKQLACIQVEGTQNKKEIFYTNLYHCFLTPSLHSDVDGWYKGADGQFHQAVGYDKYETFSLWDTYRTAHPLYSIVVPDKVEDFVKSFLSHYDETGLLPVWSFAGNETNMMMGYHSVPVIVDAYFKGIPMDFEKAYEACKETANSDAWELKEYKELGYVSTDSENNGNWSISKTIEYAFDDWSIAQFAKALNKNEDYLYFMQRSKNWRNHYDTESTFLRPKDRKGEFISGFVPREYSEYFCESNAWQYFWSVPHDIEALIDTLGKKAFISKLDSMFTYESDSIDKLPIFSTGMIGQYAHGNEPSHHVAYLFNQIGQPQKTQQRVRQIIESQYTTKPDGYCGNEDCGQMSAWLVMSALGMYPVNPADGIYHLTSPWIKSATINLINGKKFIIGTDSEIPGDMFIDSLFFDGKLYPTLTITHEQILKGGILEFSLTDK